MKHSVPNSYFNRFHENKRKQEKRNKEIVSDGKIFYNVMIIAICRVWKERMLRVEQEPDNFVEAVCKEMSNVFGTPGDYDKMCEEETGIEFLIEDTNEK